MEHTSEKLDQLMLAIAAMHKEFGVIIGKDSKGHKGTYASLPKILDSIHTMTSKHGLVLTQGSCIIEDGKNALRSLLFHPASNQWISSISLLTAHPEPQSYDQAWGGSSTYHRRYDAMMLLGIFSEDDDTDNDGSQSINDKQLGLLKAKLAGNKEKESTILQRLNIRRLEDMPWKEFNKVLEYVSK